MQNTNSRLACEVCEKFFLSYWFNEMTKNFLLDTLVITVRKKMGINPHGCGILVQKSVKTFYICCENSVNLFEDKNDECSYLCYNFFCGKKPHREEHFYTCLF